MNIESTLKQKTAAYIIKKGSSVDSAERWVDDNFDSALKIAKNIGAVTPAQLAKIIMCL